VDSKKILTTFATLTAGVAICFFGPAGKAYAATYYSIGTVVSTNLLWGLGVKTIDAFGYNASSIPANTTLKVQFSQNNFTWENSSGTVDGWDTLSDGDHTAEGSALSLSGLAWGGGYFYYKIELDAADTSATPVLDDVDVVANGTTPNPVVYYKINLMKGRGVPSTTAATAGRP